VEKKRHDSCSLKQAVCVIMATATYPGAQTERRGGAEPVGGLLGGKDPTGRFVSGVRNQKPGVRRIEFVPDS
jgi:hypothetical protein